MDAVAFASVITTGAVGIAGIGAAFLAPTWSERRREWRQQRRSLRTSRRLVVEEMGALVVALEATAEAGIAPPGEAVADGLPGLLGAPQWAAHHGVLAENLPDSVWDTVSDAYRELAVTRFALSVVIAGSSLNARQVGMLRQDAQRLKLAATALRSAEALPD
jgi:hypothetical protein